MRILLLGLAAVAAILPLSNHAAAQSACGTWDPNFHSPGVGLTTDSINLQTTLGWIDDALVFDDGSGPALYVGGDFVSIGAASAAAIARRRSGGWEAVGAGPLTSSALVHVSALAAFTNGTVPALFAAINDDVNGGSDVQFWDGSAWTGIGTGLGLVYALAVYDDGSGSALYVGGDFVSIGTLATANRIARWDPSAGWSSVGTGLSGGSSPAVFDLATHDDGTGLALVAAGRFASAGGVAGSCVARWNGAWSTYPGSFSTEVRSVQSFDDGSGAQLYAGGTFSASGGLPAANLVRWNGTNWGSVPNLTSTSAVRELSTSPSGGAAGSVLLVGTDSALVATNGGSTITSQGATLWTGTSWTALNTQPIPTPAAGGTPQSNGGANAFADFDPGIGARVYVLGGFPQIGGLGADGLARWDGSALELDDAGQGFDWPIELVRELHYPTASDTRVFAAGPFLNAGPVPAQPSGSSSSARVRTLAAWDGTSWTPMGNGLPNAMVWDMMVYDPGTGPILFAATQSGLYQWNAGSSSWSALSGLGSGAVRALAVYSGQLYAGGAFSQLVKRWNGSTWSSVGFGLGGTSVLDLELYDDGTGLALYACGDFGSILTGGTPTVVQPIVRWNGSSWSALAASPITALTTIRTLTVYDDGGATPKLIANVADASLSPGTKTYIQSWDGTSWGFLGSAYLQGPVFDLAAFDRFPGTPGPVVPFTGPSLFLTGAFSNGNLLVLDLLAWDGSAWSSYGAGTFLAAGSQFATLSATSDGAHPSLWVAGPYTSAAGSVTSGVARHAECDFQTFCAGDGLDPYVTTPCPCSNFGAQGQGCDNHANTGGAHLTGSGAVLTPAGAGYTDSVVLACSGMNNSTTQGLFFQGDAINPSGSLLGNGIDCVGGTLHRIRNQSTSGVGFAQYPLAGQVSLSQRSTNLGDVLSPGVVRYYFVTYRDIQSGCPGTETTSNAVAIVW